MLSLALSNAVEDTLSFCKTTVYFEPQSEMHTDITKSAWQKFLATSKLTSGSILDIGCGSGFAMEIFRESGFSPIGITACRTETLISSSAENEVWLMDMHEVSRFSQMFDAIWLRHAAEHSPMPLVLLRSCRAALKPGGWMYLEVPLPSTACRHDSDNANHFSVLTADSWRRLIACAGFVAVDAFTIKFDTAAGPDEYFGMILNCA